jgi:hypothetical protein
MAVIVSKYADAPRHFFGRIKWDDFQLRDGKYRQPRFLPRAAIFRPPAWECRHPSFLFLCSGRIGSIPTVSWLLKLRPSRRATGLPSGQPALCFSRISDIVTAHLIRSCGMSGRSSKAFYQSDGFKSPDGGKKKLCCNFVSWTTMNELLMMYSISAS